MSNHSRIVVCRIFWGVNSQGSYEKQRSFSHLGLYFRPCTSADATRVNRMTIVNTMTTSWPRKPSPRLPQHSEKPGLESVKSGSVGKLLK